MQNVRDHYDRERNGRQHDAHPLQLQLPIVRHTSRVHEFGDDNWRRISPTVWRSGPINLYVARISPPEPARLPLLSA